MTLFESCAIWCCIHFKWMWLNFTKPNEKFPVYSFLSFLAERTEKKRRLNKSMRKMLWLQTAKIILIYAQDIMLNNNTIRLSLFRPEFTSHSVLLLFRQTSYNKSWCANFIGSHLETSSTDAKCLYFYTTNLIANYIALVIYLLK